MIYIRPIIKIYVIRIFFSKDARWAILVTVVDFPVVFQVMVMIARGSAIVLNDFVIIHMDVPLISHMVNFSQDISRQHRLH